MPQAEHTREVCLLRPARVGNGTRVSGGDAFAKPYAWGTPSSPAPNNGNGSAASSGFNQLRNEFLTAARRVVTTKKQAIGEVVEWASGGAFEYGDVGHMTEDDIPKLRAARLICLTTNVLRFTGIQMILDGS